MTYRRNESDFLFIDSIGQVNDFIEEHKGVEWIGFDTEFIGEKRFYTELCVIQISSEKGVYIFDYAAIKNIDFLLDMIQDPKILKITHAGENDYRLLFNQYKILPQNVVDVQILAGFLGYSYPSSFGKLVAGELSLYLNKGFTVTDWSRRPLSPKQLKYAARDVLYLQEMWHKMKAKLEEFGRLDWALEECERITKRDFYQNHPDKEFLDSNLRPNLKQPEGIFLLRFLRWRRSEAERLNHSKAMIYPSKNIAMLTRAVGGGRQSLQQNRRLSERFVRKMGDFLLDMFNQEPTEEELSMLGNKEGRIEIDPRQELLTKILDQMIHLRCMDEKMAHEMVLPRSIMKVLRADPNAFDERLETGWRSIYLGEGLIDWLKNRGQLNLTFKDGQFQFFRKEVEV